MARKSMHIKTLTTKDKEVLNMLSKTGQSTIEQLQKLNNISVERLNKLEKSGYIDKSISTKGNIYSLNEKSHKLIDGGIYHKAGLNHDLKLSEQYLNLTKEQQQSVQTGDYYARSNSLEVKGTPDLVVINTIEQVPIFIEVITSNYKEIDIQLKQEFANICKSELRLVYTKGGK